MLSEDNKKNRRKMSKEFRRSKKEKLKSKSSSDKKRNSLWNQDQIWSYQINCPKSLPMLQQTSELILENSTKECSKKDSSNSNLERKSKKLIRSSSNPERESTEQKIHPKSNLIKRFALLFLFLNTLPNQLDCKHKQQLDQPA